MACTGFRCQGTIAFEREDTDDFDLMLLDQKFAMIRPREHSAQIPAADREALERAFKSEGERLNTLVATPTLELGVDIGALDSVLMRNVPPRSSNYWQRAGRAGRRQRMAVNITYARPVSHDRAYFADPLKMLNGAILPPNFNLKNEVMVRKHVHATVLTVLHRIAHDSTVPLGQRQPSVAPKKGLPRAD
jgi:superfamily II DNA/RNA helicase